MLCMIWVCFTTSLSGGPPPPWRGACVHRLSGAQLALLLQSTKISVCKDECCVGRTGNVRVLLVRLWANIILMETSLYMMPWFAWLRVSPCESPWCVPPAIHILLLQHAKALYIYVGKPSLQDACAAAAAAACLLACCTVAANVAAWP